VQRGFKGLDMWGWVGGALGRLRCDGLCVVLSESLCCCLARGYLVRWCFVGPAIQRFLGQGFGVSTQRLEAEEILRLP
jgi:hypothetical protein